MGIKNRIGEVGKQAKSIYALFNNDGKMVDLLSPSTGKFKIIEVAGDGTEKEATVMAAYYISVLSGKWYMDNEFYDKIMKNGRADIDNAVEPISGELVALAIAVAQAILRGVKKTILWYIENSDKVSTAFNTGKTLIDLSGKNKARKK